MHKIFSVFRKTVLIMLPLLTAISCASPTMAPPADIQPAIPVTNSGYHAALTAIDSNVIVINPESSATEEIQSGENINVWIADRIEVSDKSRALLSFPEFLDVELFRSAQLVLTDAKLEAGEAISVNLNQIQGHVGISLHDRAHTRVTLESQDAVIKTLENGSEFIVCVKPDVITCVEVLKGSVEVTGQGKKVILKEGEASYVPTGEPPASAICAPVTVFQDWKEQMRQSTDTPAITAIVKNLPQRPCVSSEMAPIEGGLYQIGSESANEFHSAVRDISLERFWIDLYEVTNIQYQYYLDRVSGQQPAVGSVDWGHPVRGVTWDQASAYCSWAGKRLPSEAEWEVAGRGPGPDAPVFPWGNDPQAGGEIVNLPLENTYEVGTIAFNVSPFGVYDLAGNVWEWVGEPYENMQAGFQILRGGRFGFIKDLTYRQQAASNDERFVPYTGFRCATSQLEEK